MVHELLKCLIDLAIIGAQAFALLLFIAFVIICVPIGIIFVVFDALIDKILTK